MKVSNLEKQLTDQMVKFGFNRLIDGVLWTTSIEGDYAERFGSELVFKTIRFNDPLILVRDRFGRSATGKDNLIAAARLWLKAAQSLQPETVLN